MRTYKITVNGQVYNVDVEEIGASAPVAAAPVAGEAVKADAEAAKEKAEEVVEGDLVKGLCKEVDGEIVKEGAILNPQYMKQRGL